MGIEIQDLKKILEHRNLLPNGGKALILGDAVFHFDLQKLTEVSGHKFDKNQENVVTLSHLKSALSLDEIDTIDLFGNPTIKKDLHDPTDSILMHKYDWIIDAGTLFCCFDIAKVLENCLNMLKPHGVIIHWSGLTGYFGRSYYSISPQLYSDFYRCNNFDLINLSIRSKSKPSFIDRIANFIGVSVKNQLEWESIDPNHFYLSQYTTSKRLIFKDSGPEFPKCLPNDSLVFCVASRKGLSSFKRAIPDYYKRLK